MNIALVLSSGGARGYAHIGAIEALQSRGHRITSVAGTSMGALVGGMYCAGQLSQVKQWMCSISQKDMLALTDFSLSLNHLVKGNRVMDALRQLVPDVPIEQLAVPFCAVATDLQTRREVAFRKGSDVAEAVDNAFDELKADGTMQTLADKYGLTLAE